MNDRDTQDQSKAYWRANLALLSKLLLIWLVVSLGFGIALADWLDQFQILGFKLGFWFSQQGSMLVFIVLIFFYSWRMNVIDKKFDVDDVGERDET
jgi:putative solute:sodium symporter small subunit